MPAGFVSCFWSSIGEPAFVGVVLRFNLLVKLGVCVCVGRSVGGLRLQALGAFFLSFFLSFLPSFLIFSCEQNETWVRGILLVFTQCYVGHSNSLEPTLIRIMSVNVGHFLISTGCAKICSLKLVWVLSIVCLETRRG
jgi:hypothetical protein